MKLFWTDQALGQLEDIFDYYKVTAQISTARKIATTIVDKTVLLETTPRLGQKEELLQDRKERISIPGRRKLQNYILDRGNKKANKYCCNF